MEDDVNESKPFVGEPEREGEAAPDGDASPREAGAVSAARSAGRQLASGYAAVRDVRKASRRHAGARSQVRTLQRELSTDEATLAHRLEVEEDYGRIVSDQTRELESAEDEAKTQRARKEQLERELSELKAQLKELKSRHEDELRPYRNILDTTKGRSDAAAVALAEAKRAVKVADGRMTEAIRSRDQRLQAANRALDGAQGRLHKAEAELERLQSDEGASAAVVERARGEVASERSAVASAKSDVVQATSDAQLSVDNAQTHLWTARQSLEVAERQAEAAKQEATTTRKEYDTLYRRAREEEAEAEAAIKERSHAMASARTAAEAADARARAARELLDEANDIRSTPEMTEALQRKVGETRADLDRQKQAMGELAREEKGLRRQTRRARAIFLIALIVVVVVLALIVWRALGR